MISGVQTDDNVLILCSIKHFSVVDLQKDRKKK